MGSPRVDSSQSRRARTRASVEFETIGVVGAGLMDLRIGSVFALNGGLVLIVDSRQEGLDRAKQRMARQFVSPKERLLTHTPQVSASPIFPCSPHCTGAPKIRAHARGHQALPRDSESFPRESIL
jgi:hypothetical protein